MNTRLETTEEYRSKIPALHVLLNLGWTYLSPEACMSKRGSDSVVLLKDELRRALQKRRFEWAGESRSLSDNSIQQIIRELSAPALNEGLLTANEQIYDKLTLGVSVKEFVDGKPVQPTIQIIDWEHPENNVFHATEELEVRATDGIHHRRPDIVCFVNGIPLVVIEAKRPESSNPNKAMITEGISQHLRNQSSDEIPLLFCYAQILMAISETDGRYGTTYTALKFWSAWREEKLDKKYFSSIKNAKLSEEQKNAIFANRPQARDYFEKLWAKGLACTEQDILLISLLTHERLFKMIRYYTLFSKGSSFKKVIARYQQAFGVRAMLERLKTIDRDGSRQGGIIWHTTGSGKSYTMVFLTKALLLEPDLRDCRVIVVTDRIDLENQLKGTFCNGGAFGSAIGTKKDGENAKARTGRDLAKRIGQGSDRILFTIIDKFATASKLPECKNTSNKLIVLVDEGHRSQGGETHERMHQALPNAGYIAFTGTPLLNKNKKTTEDQFGPIIHAYTMQRAVEDRTVTPLLYEERRPELDVNEKAIDRWFDQITQGLSEKQKADLKRKFATKDAVCASGNRIDHIAKDIALHFSSSVKALDNGLKAQLATDSKLSAIRYKKCLDETGLVQSAVIISPPDTREGHTEVDEKELPEVQQWFKDTVKPYPSPQDYERAMLKSFSKEDGLDLLIVVDKLLTGFDEPRNAILYIDKSLKGHNLLQAIARVNRLHEAKKFGYLIDYRGVLSELDTTLKEYQNLEKRTQGGFDIADIEGLYSHVDTEYKKLPELHKKLWNIFSDVKTKGDPQQFRQKLMPKFADNEDGVGNDLNLKRREDFYEAFTEFGMCLKTALSSHSFYEDKSFTEANRDEYKATLRWFNSIRATARQDAQESVDYSAYEKQIRELVDEHVVATGILPADGLIDVNGIACEAPEDWSKEKLRNETDLIKTRLRKTIEQDLGEDPYAQKVFSKLLKEAIENAEKMFEHSFDQYTLFKEFEDKVNSRSVDGIPEELSDNKQACAYYGTFRLVLGEDHFQVIEQEEESALIQEAKIIDTEVDKAIAEHSLSQQAIESSIKQKLLPQLFKLLDRNMNKAREVIDHIIQITRVRLAHEKK